MNRTIKILVWNEFRHEKEHEEVRILYPEGIHKAIAAFLEKTPGMAVETAVLDDPGHGLSEEKLKETDVLIWWGHLAHGEVSDSAVDLVQKHVLNGMGLIVLHSGHHSKIFRRLMGTSCSLIWREAAEKERIWVTCPSHPITQGLPPYFEVPHAEMYGEFFDIPQPDELIFTSWFEGGNVFRSGLAYHRGRGKIFYFRPGHETYPVFYQKEIQTVITNACRWAAPEASEMSWRAIDDCPHNPDSLEPLGGGE